MVTYTYMIIWVAGTRDLSCLTDRPVRVILFAVDPHSGKQVLPRVVSSLLLNIPIVFWIAAGFLLALYW